MRLRLVPRLLALAELLFHLPMAVVPLGLAAVWGEQASQYPQATGGGSLVTVAAVAMSR